VYGEGVYKTKDNSIRSLNGVNIVVFCCLMFQPLNFWHCKLLLRNG